MKHRLDYSDKKVTIKKSVINAHLIQEFRDTVFLPKWIEGAFI